MAYDRAREEAGRWWVRLRVRDLKLDYGGEWGRSFKDSTGRVCVGFGVSFRVASGFSVNQPNKGRPARLRVVENGLWRASWL